MSNKPSIDDYLKTGIYGMKEIKPDERNRFLGTLRERIVVALTQQQVKEPGTYLEVEELLRSNPKAKLYLNGQIQYSYLSDYIKLANKYGNPFTSVTNKQSKTDIGLVLAYDYAIEKEEVFLEKSRESTKEEEQNKESIISKFFKNLF
ncbi:YueI family protein [Bacillus salitolerans]|uniref:YueI family protein n=1 Tax=Bacillus salitolerans TaxID=1437434 RepID=A0ABW4LSR9_9BACI